HTGGWSLADALRVVHAPPADADRRLLSAGLHPAQQRLAFEELVAHQLGLLRRRQRQLMHDAPALPAGADTLTPAFLRQLPFALTDAQQRVLAEIR
ncbi:ATP-dependent DNA helicase RecG, partial [Acinetobacter baumannii]